jgi:predicted transcriptional regulator
MIVGMENGIYVAEGAEIALIARALDSELRRKIIDLLDRQRMNINQIASALGIPQSTCAVNVQILEKAKLIRTEQVSSGKGAQKICSLRCDEVVLPLRREPSFTKDRYITNEMPIGLYTDFKATPPCGVLNDTGIIGFFDVVDSFLSPKRAGAGLIWFTHGYLDYRFSSEGFIRMEKIVSLSVSAEICSEFPGFNTDWPSEITLWINDLEIGTWISPGDMGGDRGRFTPAWWDVRNSQFGFLKSWKISTDGCYIDGVKVGDTTLADMDIHRYNFFKVRLGVKEDAEYQGGLNLFGRTFGNYEQDIILRIELAE